MAVPPAGSTVPSAAFEKVFRSSPVALLLIRADGLVMADPNPAYLAQVGMRADDIVGRHVFDVFPDNPDNEDGDQATSLERLMTTAIARRTVTRIEGLRYDIPVADGFEMRWWNASETPVLAADGSVEFLLHFSEDVTELHRARGALEQAEREQERSAERVTIQAELALTLSTAATVEEIESLVVNRGLALLGADGGAVFTRSDDGGWDATLPLTRPGTTPPASGERHGWLPYDSPLPAVTAARRGRPVLLPDRAAGLAFHPEVARIHQLFDCHGYASLPLVAGTRRIGALSLWWAEPHTCSDSELELLEGIAAQCALALDRAEQAEAQRLATLQLQELAESLQAAMITPPPPLPGLEIAVRYRTADDVAKVGGDWYDAFVQPDGASMVVIGDVCGHDHIAAGKMGQMRGLLRALAFDPADQPHGVTTAATLERYEEVAAALGVIELATVVLARVEPDGTSRSVRWANAGSPPPVLLQPDGVSVLLDPKPDLMLGVDESAERREHVTELLPGATLLLYTDGLVERRDVSIDDGISDLRRAVDELAGATLEDLCDGVLARLSPHIGEDDVALLALRCRDDS